MAIRQNTGGVAGGGGGGAAGSAGVITNTPGYPLFDLVNNSDVGVKATLAGDGSSFPGFPPKVLTLAKAIAKKGAGPLSIQATQFSFTNDWTLIEDALPSEQKVTRALLVLSQRFWFNGRPYSPPQHGGDVA